MWTENCFLGRLNSPHYKPISAWWSWDGSQQKEPSKTQTQLQYQSKLQQQTRHQTHLTTPQMNWADRWGYASRALRLEAGDWLVRGDSCQAIGWKTHTRCTVNYWRRRSVGGGRGHRKHGCCASGWIRPWVEVKNRMKEEKEEIQVLTPGWRKRHERLGIQNESEKDK